MKKCLFVFALLTFISMRSSSSEADFIKFYNDPFTLFEKDLYNIYKIK